MKQATEKERVAAATETSENEWYARGDAWVLAQKGWEPERSLYYETIFSLANGYMGHRGYREESDNVHGQVREGYLAGVFSKLPPIARKLVVHDYEWDSRQMVSLPEIFAALVSLGGEAFNLLDGQVIAYTQCLDMRTAQLVRTVEWQGESGRQTRLRFKRWLHACMPQLAVHEIEVEPLNWSGEVEIWYDYDLLQKTVFRCGDPAKAALACPHYALNGVMADGARVSGVVETVGSGHRIAMGSRILGCEADSIAEPTGLLAQHLKMVVNAGAAASVVRLTAIATTRDQGVEAPLATLDTLLDGAAAQGVEALERGHKAAWAARWQRANIELDGPARDQKMIRFGLFSLLQIAPFHADNLSIPARCYAYNRYNGLYFWDGEIFLLPFYQFCSPDVARNLLRFRTRTLAGARRNAAALGSRGALFPWQGDADYGEDQAPWGLQTYLWHQNADIIYAFDQYARATGDVDFMCEHALPALAETARFWLAQLEVGEDERLHLMATVGPDEAEEHGPDNGYTALMAQRSLETSVRWWQLAQARRPEHYLKSAAAIELAEEEIRQWQRAAELIHIAEVPELPGVPLQDAFLLGRKREALTGMTVDEFWQRRGAVQVIKQADILLAMYLLEDKFTTGQIADAYEFYEPRTLHVSSLSYNTHAIVAAGIGKEDAAYSYFLKAAGLDLDNLRNATKDGLHAAALGAVWQMVVPGFMGMRLRQDHLSFEPRMPRQWRRLEFPLAYRGWDLRVEAGAGRIAIAVSGAGESGASVLVGGQRYTLTTGALIEGEC